MKPKTAPATCPRCLSLLNDVIAEFAYFNCTSSLNVETQAFDQSKKCVKQEKIVSIKLLDFLKKKKKDKS